LILSIKGILFKKSALDKEESREESPRLSLPELYRRQAALSTAPDDESSRPSMPKVYGRTLREVNDHEDRDSKSWRAEPPD
jgi:hypothetical protein